MTEIAEVPAERLGREQPLLRSLPSLRPAPGPDHRPQGRPPGDGALRIGALLRPDASDRPARRAHGDRRRAADRPARRELARHGLVPPGEVSLEDAHYGGPPHHPARAVRPRSAVELAFCALGPLATAFLRAAAARATPRLAAELADIVGLERAYGRERLLLGLERALRFGRFRAADVRAILEARTASAPVAAGAELALRLPRVPVRPLSAYSLERQP